jgi:hypothetical protein
MRLEPLAGRFPDHIRRRGESYEQGGCVDIVEHNPALIRAVVLGSEQYSVNLRGAGNTLVLGCTCSYFSEHGPCKHLWATLLCASNRNLLRVLPSFRRLDFDAQLAAGKPTNAQLRAAATLESKRPQTAPPTPSWQEILEQPLRSRLAAEPSGVSVTQTPMYVLDAAKTLQSGELELTLRTRGPKKKGGWAKDKAAHIPMGALASIADECDRKALPICQAAVNMGQQVAGAHPRLYDSRLQALVPSELRLPTVLADTLLPLVSDAGRLFIREAPGAEPKSARFEPAPPWDLELRLRRSSDGASGELSAGLRRGDQRLDLTEPLVLTASGWILFRDRVAKLRHFDAFHLVTAFRRAPRMPVARTEEQALLEKLFNLPSLPRLDLPAELSLKEVFGTPRPVLEIHAPRGRAWQRSVFPVAELCFAYDALTVSAGDPRDALPQINTRRVLRRDRVKEIAAAEELVALGFQRVSTSSLAAIANGNASEEQAPREASAQREGPEPRENALENVTHRYEIAPTLLPEAVRLLLLSGWRVQAEGKIYRQMGRFDLSVSSGVDWFDVHAQVEFDGVAAELPELLKALRHGEGRVLLGDGSFGILPEEWLKKYGLLADLGVAQDGALRFVPTQLGLLDSLLAAEPQITQDQAFAGLREQLHQFERIEAEKAVPEFLGDLRPYQELGLGWMSFLRRFRFGGCLADDMGLGKTVQVLAMLASRPRVKGKPSLVVVPKSLVWNWQQEAARFAPRLRCLALVGSSRPTGIEALRHALSRVDLVITTYGLLRNDVAALREIEMDYVILDEAQAIKNPDSESAKAARLLRGQHRLALSGTPIENHLGELWSLVDFLNPGMLGSGRTFAGIHSSKAPQPEMLPLLGRALRPFVLRRTKEEVAPELPPKHQETLLCEMDPEQRRLYDDLRTHYRAALLGKVARDGLGKSKIQVLEALLRLRQAACHPALIDAKHAGVTSGKLEVLFERLDEVRKEGHKALIFSQFTSFLKLVRERLDAEGVIYEYLDGKVRDREARVTRFQTDAECSLFLISLKAGGVGLNLTAADYVFILDPWWNPAVEAQAIDRAHRIGQDKPVFVYRLLCRDSVEEKVAALQEEKKALVASILRAEASLIQDLDRETLELLLA